MPKVEKIKAGHYRYKCECGNEMDVYTDMKLNRLIRCFKCLKKINDSNKIEKVKK